MKYLLVIPAFFIGALVGWLLLGQLPMVVIDIIFAPQFRYSETARVLMRGAGIAGGSFAVVATVLALKLKLYEWR